MVVLVDWHTYQVNANGTANCTPITSTDANMCECQTQVLILTIHLLVNHLFIYFPFGGLALFHSENLKMRRVSHTCEQTKFFYVHVWRAHAFTIIKLFHCVHRICTIDNTQYSKCNKILQDIFRLLKSTTLKFYYYFSFFLRLSLDVLPKIY